MIEFINIIMGDQSENESDFDDENESQTGLLKFFKIKSSTHLVHCTVLDCRKTFKNWKSFNLKRHLKSAHASVFAKLNPREIDEIQRLQIMALELKFDAIELVTVNGQAFALLNASAMKGFYKDKLEELRVKRFHISLNRSTIASNVDEISSEIIEVLKGEMHNRNICLMLDTCTKGSLSVLSINARFVNDDDEIITRSLGIFELTHRHTAVLMAKTIADYLQNTFNVSMRQVKAVVTDNAANMVLTRKLLNKLALGESIEAYEDFSEGENELNDEEAAEETEAEGPSVEDELEIAEIINNNEHYSTLVSNTAQEFTRYYGTILAVNPISCSTHTMQLAIKDSLTEAAVIDVILKVNELCKTLRNQLVVIGLKRLGIKITKPPLKNITRWNTDFLLVSLVLRLFSCSMAYF